MRFEKIEMIGFKSFAEKSIFSFQPGITAIIGPNGCGKSNIVDALRWVLGEQSAKNMRGDRMEDVIFNGSEERKATGMAEVTIHLKDLNGQLPQGLSEYDEISITRRLYRSGESEYLINKVPCRLKDIKDLFLDTGLEAKSYSIIEQGKIGQILNSKPMDRRFLVEEAAGVMKYKARRAEASQKLELASQNLLRIKDITGEIERQINSLSRQVKKAERYKRIRDEIKELELGILSVDYKAFSLELLEINKRFEIVTENLTGARAKISKGETDIEGRRISLLEIEKETGSLQESLLRAEKDIGQKEKEISLLKSEISSIKEREEKNKKEIKTLTLEEETMKEQLNGVEEEGKALEEEIHGKGEDILSREDRFSLLENELSSTDETIEETKRSLFEKVSQISDIRNRITHIETLKDGVFRKKEIGEDETKKLGIELTEKENDLRRQTESMENLRKEKEGVELERRETVEEIQNNEKNLAKKEEEFIKKKELLTEKTARLSSLKEVELNLEEQEGVNLLLKEKRNALNIHGLVADILDTSPEYELAIEAALGQRLHHIVIENHESILKTIDYLKAENSGRGTFIPLEPRVIKSDPIRSDLNKGIIGESLSLVKCRDGYQKVLESLLSDTVIVSNLSTALELWSHNGVQKTLVTLEGDVIYPSGSVTGGSPSLNGGGILRKKRETKELEKDVEALRKDIVSIEEDILRISNALEILRTREQDLRLKIEGLDKGIFTIEKDIAVLQGDRDRLLKRIEILKIEEEEIEREKKERVTELSKLEENLNAALKEKEQLEERIKILNDDLNEKRDVFEDLRSELMDLKLDLATIKEKKDGILKEKERSMAFIRKGEERILALMKEIEGINQKVSEAEGRIKAEEHDLNLILRERVDHSNQITRMKEVQKGLYEEIENLEESLRNDRDALESIQAEEGEIEVRRAELTVKIEHIVQSLRNNYNLSIDEIISVPESIPGDSGQGLQRREAEEKLAHLKERLESLGAVNLTAIEEYNELRERYDFLTAQQNDLIQSIDSLKDAIAKIDRTTEQRLREAFRNLNDRFQEVFRTLFEGGKAELILDGGDILNSGIEIIAQPPGKKLQHLSLLSGGEKALTAIAILFASFLVKPSPLCLMDEVDAPLDDTNIDRFASILKGLSESTQFIVITHNKRTMEAANVLYGITMEERGISKVVSVRLDGDNGNKEAQMALKK